MNSKNKNEWNISIDGNQVTLTRMKNGKAVETYRPTNKEGALLD